MQVVRVDHLVAGVPRGACSDVALVRAARSMSRVPPTATGSVVGTVDGASPSCGGIRSQWCYVDGLIAILNKETFLR